MPYPKDKKTFKAFVALGTELRLLHLLESPKVNQFITTFPIDGNGEVEKIKFETKNIVISTEGRNLNSKRTKDFSVEDSFEMTKTAIQKVGKVWINKTQYFGKVPETAWNFYIGGYQPAQKWLKDRKGRELTNQEIEHYQKIIVALSETERILKEIDKINL